MSPELIAALVAQIPLLIGLVALWIRQSMTASAAKRDNLISAQKVQIDRNASDIDNIKIVNTLAQSALVLQDRVHELEKAALMRSEAEKDSVAKIAELTTTVNLAYTEIKALNEKLDKQGILLQAAYDEITRLVTQKHEQAGLPAPTAPLNDYATQNAAIASQAGTPPPTLPVTGDTGPQQPILPDGVQVSLVGTLSVDHTQEVPPPPAGAVDAETGKVVKIA